MLEKKEKQKEELVRLKDHRKEARETKNRIKNSNWISVGLSLLNLGQTVQLQQFQRKVFSDVLQVTRNIVTHQ